MSYTNEELKELGRWFIEAFLEVYPTVESTDPNRIRQALGRWFMESIDPQKPILNRRQRMFASLSDEDIAAFRAVPVKVDPLTHCHLWQGDTSRSGWGRFRKTWSKYGSNRCESAHHLAYFLHHGSLPLHDYLYQSCRNRLCVNPDHLLVSAVRGGPRPSRNVANRAKSAPVPSDAIISAERWAQVMKSQEGS
jgi:hypothetical protein